MPKKHATPDFPLTLFSYLENVGEMKYYAVSVWRIMEWRRIGIFMNCNRFCIGRTVICPMDRLFILLKR